MLRKDSLELDFNTLINGKYKPVKWLEPGGMSQVLQAEQVTVNNRPVVLKFLTWQQEGDQKEQRQRYEQEMKAMAQLPHQRIVHLYEFEWYGDIPYLVMEYMPNGSLKHKLPDLYRNREKAYKILKALCETVEYIHQHGIVHCDLKPSNTLFDVTDDVRISDFGIAKLPDHNYLVSSFIGTPGYMAPEQINKAPNIDRRVDIYALGVIAWQLFGRQFPPEPHHPPYGQFSHGLLQALLKALATNRDDRYASASEFLKAISPFVSEEPCGRVIFQIPFTYRNQVRQMFQDYTLTFGGREREMQALDVWLEDSEHPFAFLQTPAGQGKTALLIHWALDVQLQGQWQVIFHPISLRYGTAVTIAPTVRCLAEALAPIFEENPPDSNQSPDLIKPQVTEWLRRDLPSEKQVVVIIDGVDEAEGWNISELFPNTLGRGFKLLLSARSLGGEHQRAWLTRLKWDVSQTLLVDRLSRLDQTGLADLLRAVNIQHLNTLAEDSAFLGQLERVSEGDPLTTRYIIDALRDGDMTPQSLAHHSPGLQALLNTWLEQLDEQIQHQQLNESQKQAAKDLLGLCAIALGPFTAEDLGELLPERFEDAFQIRETVRHISRFVIGQGVADSGYIFSHPKFREFFAEKLLSRQRQKYQQAFLDYGQRIFVGLPQQTCPVYLRQFWMTHLANAGEWERLQTSLLKQNEQTGKYVWAEMRHGAEGSYAGFLSDLDKLWRHAEETNYVTVQLECALIQSTILTLSGNIEPELLIQLVTVGTSEGKWSVPAALEYIKNMPDEQKAHALELIIQYVDDVHRPEIFEIACGISLNAKFKPKREIENSEQAEKKSDGLLSISLHANTLITLASYFPASLCRRALKEAILVQTQQIEMYQPSSLAKLVSRLSQFSEDVREEIIADALKTAQHIENEAYKTHAIINLIPYLTQSQQPQIIQQIILFTQNLDDESEADLKIQTLIDLAPYLPEKLRDELMLEALSKIPMIKDRFGINSDISKEFALTNIAPHLQESAIIKALELAKKLKKPGLRLEALCGIIPYLPPTFKGEFLQELLEELQAVEDEEWRAEILTKLMPHLPEELFEDAIQILQIQPQNFSTWLSTFKGIAPYLPETLKKEIIEEEWKFALTENYSFDEDPLEVLVSLVPHLQDDLLDENLSRIISIIKEVSEIDDKYEFLNPRLDALIRIVPSLVSQQIPLAQILELTKTFQSEWEQMEVLLSLISQISEDMESLELMLEMIQGFENEEVQAKALKSFAISLPANPRFIEKLLLIGEGIKQPEKRVEALLGLIPYSDPKSVVSIIRIQF